MAESHDEGSTGPRAKLSLVAVGSFVLAVAAWLAGELRILVGALAIFGGFAAMKEIAGKPAEVKGTGIAGWAIALGVGAILMGSGVQWDEVIGPSLTNHLTSGGDPHRVRLYTTTQNEDSDREDELFVIARFYDQRGVDTDCSCTIQLLAGDADADTWTEIATFDVESSQFGEFTFRVLGNEERMYAWGTIIDHDAFPCRSWGVDSLVRVTSPAWTGTLEDGDSYFC